MTERMAVLDRTETGRVADSPVGLEVQHPLPDTQISGKYSPDNLPLFAFRDALASTGTHVSFPASGRIIAYECEFAITVPEEAKKPFHQTEIALLRDIRKNPVHITYNRYQDRSYIGESTGVETAYAMLHRRPIVLMEPVGGYSPRTTGVIREIINRHEAQMIVATSQERQSPREMARLLGSLASQGEVEYGLQDFEKEQVMSEVLRLTRQYEYLWRQYQQNRATGVVS